MSHSQIRIQAMISAPLSKVWSYWTQPEHITQWNFAAPEWHCPEASNDLRAGGKYFARMEAKDRSFGFDFEAIYDEVVEQKNLCTRLPTAAKSRRLSKAKDITRR